MYVVIDPEVIRVAFCEGDGKAKQFLWLIFDTPDLKLCNDDDLQGLYLKAIEQCGNDALLEYTNWFKTAPFFTYGFSGEYEIHITTSTKITCWPVRANCDVEDINSAERVIMSIKLSPTTSNYYLSKRNSFKTLFESHFKTADIVELCFEKGIHDENIKGDTLSAKTIGIIEYFLHRSRFDELREWCRSRRPDVTWW